MAKKKQKKKKIKAHKHKKIQEQKHKEIKEQKQEKIHEQIAVEVWTHIAYLCDCNHILNTLCLVSRQVHELLSPKNNYFWSQMLQREKFGKADKDPFYIYKIRYLESHPLIPYIKVHSLPNNLPEHVFRTLSIGTDSKSTEFTWLMSYGSTIDHSGMAFTCSKYKCKDHGLLIEYWSKNLRSKYCVNYNMIRGMDIICCVFSSRYDLDPMSAFNNAVGLAIELVLTFSDMDAKPVPIFLVGLDTPSGSNILSAESMKIMKNRSAEVGFDIFFADKSANSSANKIKRAITNEVQNKFSPKVDEVIELNDDLVVSNSICSIV